MTEMKKIGCAALAGLMFFVLSLHPASAAQQKVRFKVPGITWASSGMAASYAAESAEGVTDADDNPDEQMLTVIFDDARTTIEKIKKTMAKEGFPVEGEPEFLNK